MALAIAAGCLGASSAFGQSTIAQVLQGQAQLQQQGNSLVVTTQNAAGTNRSVINWQSFSVPAGSTTRFDQPNAQSLSINRVIGNDPSAIYGTLSSNGRLVLVNPAGIAVGAGAVVDTAGFTASTLRMSDADALAGRLRFQSDGAAGPLSVNGSIVGRSGDVVLIAPQVQVGAQAVVESKGGSVILAAGQSVELTGPGLEGIVMQVQAPGDSAVNLGTLKGDAVGIFAGTLKHSGLIQAQTATLEGGRVVLRAQESVEVTSGAVISADGADGKPGGQITIQSNGQTNISGAIISVQSASLLIEAPATLTSTGGRVEVLGGTISLGMGATVDASGDTGGGTIHIGGQSLDVPNITLTYIAPDVLLGADARVIGNGGNVVVLAAPVTSLQGQLSMRDGIAIARPTMWLAQALGHPASRGQARVAATLFAYLAGRTSSLLTSQSMMDIVRFGFGAPAPLGANGLSALESQDVPTQAQPVH